MKNHLLTLLTLTGLLLSGCVKGDLLMAHVVELGGTTWYYTTRPVVNPGQYVYKIEFTSNKEVKVYHRDWQANTEIVEKLKYKLKDEFSRTVRIIVTGKRKDGKDTTETFYYQQYQQTISVNKILFRK